MQEIKSWKNDVNRISRDVKVTEGKIKDKIKCKEYESPLSWFINKFHMRC